MGENHTIGNIMGITMDKLKEMVDVNTIIGDPIQLQDGTAIIPISKVSFGFASGGSDLPSKNVKDLFWRRLRRRSIHSASGFYGGLQRRG